jgi:hypothetical protein
VRTNPSGQFQTLDLKQLRLLPGLPSRTRDRANVAPLGGRGSEREPPSPNNGGGRSGEFSRFPSAAADSLFYPCPLASRRDGHCRSQPSRQRAIIERFVRTLTNPCASKTILTDSITIAFRRLAFSRFCMARELISKKTRMEFREYLVGWTLATIANEFDAAEIDCDRQYQPPLSGERRSLVAQYYHTLDLTKPEDARKLLQAFENVLVTASNDLRPYLSVEQRDESVRRLCACLKRDGYVFENGRILPITGAVSLSGLQAEAVKFDAEYLAQQINRIEQSVDADPAHAIGSAKELIETCCKTILADRGAPCCEKLDVLPLVRRTLEELKLIPDGVPDETKGARSIKSLLGSLASMCQSLAELRNLYGTGHGKGGRVKGLSPRHARLAVGGAVTLANFLFETHRERELVARAPTR